MPLGKLIFYNNLLDVLDGKVKPSAELTPEEKETMEFIRNNRDELLKLVGFDIDEQ